MEKLLTSQDIEAFFLNSDGPEYEELQDLPNRLERAFRAAHYLAEAGQQFEIPTLLEFTDSLCITD